MKGTKLGKLGIPLLAVAVLVGCEDDGGSGSSGGDFGDNDRNVVVAMGDSITAGYGVGAADSYPVQLSAMIGRTVVNTGVNGERSIAASGRVNGVLSRYKPAYLLILYGSNDATNGGDPAATVAGLRSIVLAARANKTVPILGTIPPAFGSHAFSNPGVDALNPFIRQMAQEEGVAVADIHGALNDPALFQDDGLHPNAAGMRRIASAFAGRI